MIEVVRAEGLVKRYGTSPEVAVDGIDFAVRHGECFGFLGPNGAGKTTTMRMISCRAQRTAGSKQLPDGNESHPAGGEL